MKTKELFEAEKVTADEYVQAMHTIVKYLADDIEETELNFVEQDYDELAAEPDFTEASVGERMAVLMIEQGTDFLLQGWTSTIRTQLLTEVRRRAEIYRNLPILSKKFIRRRRIGLKRQRK